MSLSAGARFEPYEIIALLGKGGMGEVYRARDTRLHRTVAIKTLPHDKVAVPERRRRFLQEARAASALNQPNIVTLHDIANDTGIDYLFMEYVPGKSLDQLITPKAMPLMEALGYAQQIASALAAAHGGRDHPSGHQTRQRDRSVPSLSSAGCSVRAKVRNVIDFWGACT